MSVSERICAWVSVISQRWIVGSMSTHLILNYSSCQLPCPVLLWKPLTKSFTLIPMDSSFHPILCPSLSSRACSLIISSLIHSFTGLFLRTSVFSSVFLLLPLFSVSVFLISPKFPMTHHSFFSVLHSFYPGLSLC